MIIAVPTIGAVIAIVLILLSSNQIVGVVNGCRAIVTTVFMVGLFAGMAYMLLLLGAFLPIIFGSIGIIFGLAPKGGRQMDQSRIWEH